MSKGLMRKTKQELVDIILRKDDVEVQFQKQLKACQDELEQVKQVNQNYRVSVTNLHKECTISNVAYEELKQNNAELATTLAEKEEIVNGLEDLVEENQLHLIMLNKRNTFYYRLAVVAIIFVLIELFLLLELMF